MFKIWYRHRGVLEVDLVDDRMAALRRAAAIFTNERRESMELAGVEEGDGELVDLDSFFGDYLKSYRLRGLGQRASQSPKWYVEVLSPLAVREDYEDEWVRYHTESTQELAERKAEMLHQEFGPRRVRVSPALGVRLVDAGV